MTIFISDSHFGSGTDLEQKHRRQLFCDCLDHYSGRLEKLVIMGDLFDFWFEWKYVILKQHFGILCKLKSLAASGVEIHYLSGNHDFALSRFLHEEIGAKVYLDHVILDLAGKRFYLYHGDGIAPADWGYRFLKRLFRQPINHQLFSWIHPDVGLSLAHRCSSTSRNHTGRRWDVDGAAYREAAAKILAKGYDYVVFAHTHEPVLEPVGSGVYLNTGDWMRYFSYAVFEQGQVTLKYWGRPYIERAVR